MLRVTLEGYFPIDGCKFREAYYCKIENQQLAVVQATQFVLNELKNYHNGVIFTSVFVVNVDSHHRNYGRGVAEGIENLKEEKFPSEDFFKEKSMEHHASQEATQKVRQDPFTESR